MRRCKYWHMCGDYWSCLRCNERMKNERVRIEKTMAESKREEDK